MVKGWITACAIAACAAAPPMPSAALPPAGAAVIAHEETGDRLYVADFAGGKLRPVGPAGEAPHQPVWSLGPISRGALAIGSGCIPRAGTMRP